MPKSNCLIFALWMWFKHPGSYLVIRWSKFYPGPHFLWGHARQDGRIATVHFVPRFPRKRLFPPLFFDGRLKLGDLSA
jgi:hypothetical protein